MPYSIEFENLPAGYAAAAARGEGMLPVLVSEFVSSDDGDKLISRLDGIPAQILSMLPPEANATPSRVDHLLAIIRRDKTATVYLNELQITARALTKRAVSAGQALHADDIADVVEVTFGDVEVPKSAGVVIVFSVGWRKGLFYDLSPLQAQHARARRYELGRQLAAFYSYLFFNHLFKITSDDWGALFRAGWFPFQGLRNETIRALVSHLRNSWGTDELVPQISQEVRDAVIPSLLERCSTNRILQPHLKFVRRAADHLARRDFISASSVLYPRLEGIMRAIHGLSGQTTKPAQQNLVAAVVQTGGEERHPYSLLLPEMFRRFLADVYFRDFNPTSDIELSRHSVSHGTARDHDFAERGALLGFLILDQLSLFLAGLAANLAGTREPVVERPAPTPR